MIIQNHKNLCLGQLSYQKNADIDKHKYYRKGIWFDGHGTFSVGNVFGEIVIILDQIWERTRAKCILIIVEDPTQELDDTTLTAEK